MRRTRAAFLFCLLVFFMGVAAESLPVLRFSLPPVLEALPIAFAEAWGMFEEHGVDVEIVGTPDNNKRSVAFSANQLDGMIADTTRSIYDATTGSDILVTSTASLLPQTDSIGLAVLSPDTHYGYDSFEALIDAGAAISTIYRSDYEYVLDLYLQETYGADARSIRTTYWNDTLQMAVWFGAQALPSAMLPEPYISYIETYHPPNGEPIPLNVLVDLSDLGPLPSMVVFRSAYVRENPAALEAFYAAYVQAIERINTTPRDVLIDEGIDVALGLFFQGADRTTINQEVLDTLGIPRYKLPSTLSQELYDSIGQWMLGKAYIYDLPVFEDMVDFQFIP